MANVDDGATQTLDQGGYFVTWYVDGGGVKRWRKLAVQDLKSVRDTANAAPTAEELGSAAFEDADTFVRVSELTTQLAGLQAQIDFQSVQIANLITLVGADFITILEPGIVDPTVVT